MLHTCFSNFHTFIEQIYTGKVWFSWASIFMDWAVRKICGFNWQEEANSSSNQHLPMPSLCYPYLNRDHDQDLCHSCTSPSPTSMLVSWDLPHHGAEKDPDGGNLSSNQSLTPSSLLSLVCRIGFNIVIAVWLSSWVLHPRKLWSAWESNQRVRFRHSGGLPTLNVIDKPRKRQISSSSPLHFFLQHHHRCSLFFSALSLSSLSSSSSIIKITWVSDLTLLKTFS